MGEMDLGELFTRYGSDKDLVGYTSLYHSLFFSRRHEPLNVLEIGIGTLLVGVHSSMKNYALPGYRPGGSLRAWRDYFTQSRIYGIDVQPDTQFVEDRITTYLCDSTDAHQVAALFEKLHGMEFDVVVDDGSHASTNQMATLANFYPHVRRGGFYIIEDIDPGSTLNTAPELLEPLCNGDPFFFVGLASNLCVIYNSHLARQRGSYHY